MKQAIVVACALLLTIFAYRCYSSEKTHMVELVFSKIIQAPGKLLIGAEYIDKNQKEVSILLISMDDGQTWNNSNLIINNASIIDMTVSDNRMWILTIRNEEEGVAVPNEILFSDDPCGTWKHAPLNFVKNSTGLIDQFKIRFLDQKSGAIKIQEHNAAAKYYMTTDGGSTWNQSNDSDMELKYGFIPAIDDHIAKMTGTQQSFKYIENQGSYLIEKSTSDGSTWSKVSTISKKYKLKSKLF